MKKQGILVGLSMLFGFVLASPASAASPAEELSAGCSRELDFRAKLLLEIAQTGDYAELRKGQVDFFTKEVLAIPPANLKMANDYLARPPEKDDGQDAVFRCMLRIRLRQLGGGSPK